MRIPHLALAAVMLILAGYIGLAANDLDYLTPLGPGPGFFPRWLAGVLAVLSLLLLVDAARRPRQALPADFLPDATNARQIGWVLAALVTATVALPLAGFSLAMFAMTVTVLAALGRRGLLATGVALVGSFGVYQLFTTWLAVPLPKGWFGW